MNDWSHQITLIKQTEAGRDEDGFPYEPEKTETTVFCNISSVSISEFYEARQQGYEALLRAEVREMEYNDERLARFEGEEYKVFRWYRKKAAETVELTLTRDVEGT